MKRSSQPATSLIACPHIHFKIPHLYNVSLTSLLTTLSFVLSAARVGPTFVLTIIVNCPFVLDNACFLAIALCTKVTNVLTVLPGVSTSPVMSSLMNLCSLLVLPRLCPLLQPLHLLFFLLVVHNDYMRDYNLLLLATNPSIQCSSSPSSRSCAGDMPPVPIMAPSVPTTSASENRVRLRHHHLELLLLCQRLS